jgi:ADP-ribose pyrophosphatase
MRLDEDEFLTVERMPLAQAAEMVMRGELADAKTAVGILMACRKLC